MKSKTVHAESVIGVDFSGQERRAFLQKLQRAKGFKKNVWTATQAESLIGTDVSESDRRSVKAQLAGHTAWRVFWWDLNCWVSTLMNPRVSGEQLMFAFHQRHHLITLTWVRQAAEINQLYHAIYRHGVLAGLRLLVELERTAERSDER